ncbi:hypothetical protein FB645_000618 [Coemansia sp. IMI 203386]|nr:hypothetical protein FB645_000618 [Coemansia sp. IMI 203386]
MLDTIYSEPSFTAAQPADGRISFSEPLAQSNSYANGYTKQAKAASAQLTPLDIGNALKSHGNAIAADLRTPEERSQPPFCDQRPPPHKLLPGANLNSSILFGSKFPMPESPENRGASGFTPYYMDRVEPRARELQRTSRFSLLRRQKTPPSEPSSGMLSPRSMSESGSSTESPLSPSDASPAMRIKRSISTLLRRSSSMMRRGNSQTSPKPETPEATAEVVRQTRSEDTERSQAFVSRNPSISSDGTCSGLSTDEAACALSVSHFSVAAVQNTIVSPLIGKSMVHVKVVMDADTIVVLSMMRSVVFARARERILTKLFHAGVPFVESKRRKLAIVRPQDGSLVAVVGDNPTWRSIMDAASHPGRWQNESITAFDTPKPAHQGICGAAASTSPGFRAVVKLTLHLVDPEKVTADLLPF